MGWEGVTRTSNLAAKIELGKGNFVDQSVSQQQYKLEFRKSLKPCFTFALQSISIRDLSIESLRKSGMNLGCITDASKISLL